jgi:membrane associated rhomboid family serine protease
MLGQITPVVKNLLILNILLFVVKLVAEARGINLDQILGLHMYGTPLFQPYQIISHFFMHGNGWHIIFNMFVLISFGPFLEKLWGPKRFAIMYLVSAVGAVLLYNGIGFYQVLELKQIIGNPDYIAQIDDIIRNAPLGTIAIDQIPQGSIVTGSAEYNAVLKYLTTTYVPMVGASGAIMGLMASFAILFPNTQLQLLFPPIPIKAKFLIGGYFLLDLYLSIFQQEGDNVAHLAHVGGAVAGAILVLIWRKRSNQFY